MLEREKKLVMNSSFFLLVLNERVWKKDLRSEDAGQDVTDHSTDAMDGENVKSIVNANKELELGSKVAADGANHANDEAGPRSNITRRRSNRHEAGNSP